MSERNLEDLIQAEVSAAARDGRRLRIRGGGSKDFYGRASAGAVLDLSGHRGIINYEPTELVITARAGTPLHEIETALAAQGQMLAFEPPHFGGRATLGGTIACNLSGPRRPYAGSGRDFVLGARIINGKGELLSFGGEVMKNVAGYDLSRLMAGALGTLGVLLELSLKVLPRPEAEVTLVQQLDGAWALAALQRWPHLPISAALFDGERLHLRLSGAASAVEASAAQIGGERLPGAERFWNDLKEHRLPFFAASPQPLWRLSLAANAPQLEIEGEWLYDWGGAQRWLRSSGAASEIRAAVQQAGGHATLFRHEGGADEVFQPLAPGMAQIQRQLKQAFDPLGILNAGRMYREF
jgi:glycolate oxidase FAD binding subunit